MVKGISLIDSAAYLLYVSYPGVQVLRLGRPYKQHVTCVYITPLFNLLLKLPCFLLLSLRNYKNNYSVVGIPCGYGISECIRLESNQATCSLHVKFGSGMHIYDYCTGHRTGYHQLAIRDYL